MSVALVLTARGLGGLLTAVPALRALRVARPYHQLVLAAPGWLRPIVELSGCADELHATPMAGALRWNAEPPTLAVNLHGSGPDSIADLLATDPEQLITHRHPEFPLIHGPVWPHEVHETRRWCALLESAGIPADPTRVDIAAPPEAAGERTHVVIHPGAGAPARQWPPERFAAVAAALWESGRPVVVTGTATELPLAREVAERAGLPETATVAGELTLRQLAATVAGAALVVSGDTGVGHLATAFGTPSVLVFGPNSPAWCGPPPTRSRHIALWAGHVGDPEGETPDPGLLVVSVAEVVDAAQRLLQAAPIR
ncbi:glycosyltransferase family 9 protein [Nocardia sp. NPDC052566]|uniref:glycosyltransferase family 9 protein n=1 Tax=Nocardia sp. NPDC052566 TaxID=3364330 RepID=UPI0037C5F807